MKHLTISQQRELEDLEFKVNEIWDVIASNLYSYMPESTAKRLLATIKEYGKRVHKVYKLKE